MSNISVKLETSNNIIFDDFLIFVFYENINYNFLIFTII